MDKITLLKKFGINEIVVITGPFSEKYQFNDVKYINDRKFKDHDQLGSLFVASKEIQGDVLIIFADIIFDESILKEDYEIQVEDIELLAREVLKKRKVSVSCEVGGKLYEQTKYVNIGI